MELAVSKEELFSMIKIAVREVIHEERLDFTLKNIPKVSDEEMQDIVNLHGKPKKRKAVRRMAIDL